MVNIGVLISGSGTNLQAIIDNINRGEIKGKIQIVISNRKDAYGLIRAEKAGIETLYINRKEFNSVEEYNRRILDELKRRKIELVVLAGFLNILTQEFIEEYRANNKYSPIINT